jgi:hypothetical protein
MKQLISSALLSLLIINGANADRDGDWAVYPTFDNYFSKVIDTPNLTYIQALGQIVSSSSTEYASEYPFLFAYDKEADELSALSKRNKLSENIVSLMVYNPDNHYLLIVYSNSDIDLLYDNGKCVNIPGLKNATLSASRTVNSVTFDSDGNRAYLATDFGYMIINDAKGEIAESHIYNSKINSIAKIGKNLILLTSDGAYSSDINEPHLSISSFTKISGLAGGLEIMPLTDSSFAYISNKRLIKVELNDELKATTTTLSSNEYKTYSANKSGYVLSTNGKLMQLTKDGDISERTLPDTYSQSLTGSWDFNEIWAVTPRKGLSSMKYNNDSWTLTRNAMMPNAPAVFMCRDMAWSDRYGMLFVNNPSSRQFPSYSITKEMNLSGLKDGQWTQYAPCYTNTDRGSIVTNPAGLAIDPDNPDYVYFGSYATGIVRLNLADSDDIIHFSHPSDSDSVNDGFYPIFPDNSWSYYCNLTAPAFDSSGNLWSIRHSSALLSNGPIWVWPAEARKANNYNGWVSFSLNGFENSSYDYTARVFPLKSSVNKNLVIIFPGQWDGPVIVLDHNGTFDTTADDKVAYMYSISDQDGSAVTKNYCYYAYEDQSTGLVWVGTYNGVFTFYPQNAFSNSSSVNRIKVARNDGTNLADYLLDGIPVYGITADAKGRKWFATDGGGLIGTSYNGSEVLYELTSDNSYLPDDTVFGVGYNKQNNSIMVGTQLGIAEYFLAGSATSSEDMSDVLAYPNPVRPDYYGWVTIDGLADNSIVKIADAYGNIVRELGLSEGGSVKWDVTNYDHKRVRTGVYYVLASSGPGDTNLSNVTKILVVN